MAVVLRSGDLPADSFAVVMATGIVSVAARDNGCPVVSVVLAVAAAATLAVLATLAGLRFVRTGRAFARGPDLLTHTFGLFTFVAACDVVDARLGPSRAAVAVVRRLLAAHLAPEILTPDTWVLMGALAIGTLSGATLLLGARESGGYSWLRSRWATVFPLGMYSAACAVLAVALSRDADSAAAFPAVLRSVSHVAYWVAVVAWCATAFGLARLGTRAVVGRSSTGGSSVPR